MILLQTTTGAVRSRDGTVIGFRQYGRGPAVVLLHGGMQASQSFTRLAEAMKEDFTVYVPDRRGRGMSGPHGDGYSIEKECEDLGALLDSTGAENVFGLSSGAVITMQAALRMPSIRKVALYEPPLSESPTAWLARFDREIGEGKTAAALVTVLKGLEASPAISAMPRGVLTPLIRIALAVNEKSVKAGDVAIKTLVPTMHFDVQLVINASPSLERFKAITAEVLLLGGSKSQQFLLAALDRVSSLLPSARRVQLEGLDHMGPDNTGKPEIVALELRRFFAPRDSRS